MIIEPLLPSHIEDAAYLAFSAYCAEQGSIDTLPLQPSYQKALVENLKGLVSGASGLPGFAATDGGKLLGFLAGYPTDQFFSSHKGVYVPPAGHSTAGPDRRLVYQKLYEAASGAWVREGRLVHCISIWAHDAAAVDAWYWLGFGLRCVDSIRPLTDISGLRPASLETRKAAPDDAESLYALHTEHCRYYRNAPLFMPHVDVEGGLEEFRQWLAGEGNHLWAAYRDGKPVSYIRIRQGWGNIGLDGSKTFHICGAFTSEEARGTGAGAALLQTIVDWMRAQGCERLGVDYESFNIYGSRFWQKHFTPFLYSAVRCVDDRIL